MSHTKEPWPKLTLDMCVCATPNPESEPVYLMSWDDYERARVCVNACAGYETEALERVAVEQLHQNLRSQRDELAAALEELVSRCDGEEGIRADGSNIQTMRARAALSKL